MPRQPSPEQRLEYERDKAFLLEVLGFLDDLPQPETVRVASTSDDGTLRWSEVPNTAINMVPIVSESILANEQHGFGVARSGMRLGIQDILEMTRHFSSREVLALTERLKSKGLPALAEVRARVWKTIPRVLERGKIRNEAEYYLLVECLNDTAQDSLTEDELRRLSVMVADFEDRTGKRDTGAA